MRSLTVLLAAGVFSVQNAVFTHGFSAAISHKTLGLPSTGIFMSHGNSKESVLSESSVQSRESSGGSRIMGLQRRAFFVSAAASLALMGVAPKSALAVPAVKVEEFEILLKDSAKSVLVVEFSGPKSELVTVKLVDGTTFTITDLVESSTDPRSPLKLVATCRLYKVPTKFVGLEMALKGVTSKKRKVYMNARVAEAAVKEQAKKERMAQDENERLGKIYEMELAEDKMKGGN